MTTAVRVAAHAKVNLFLRILARESSGFHQIETAFALLELADELDVRRIETGVQLKVTGGQDLGPPDENLAVRAARAVLEATGNRFGVSIGLTKRIPVRAGLGGGSSDAAAALHAVNALAGNAVPRHELLHYATRLGADVAFFASGAPAALAWGRGGARGPGAPAHRRCHPGRVRLVGRNASRARATRAAAARRRRVHRMGQCRTPRRQRLRAPRLREASAAARAVRATGRHTSLLGAAVRLGERRGRGVRERRAAGRCGDAAG